MCRVLAYLGPKVTLADLITRPANSLINQSFDAEYHDLLQIAGTGFASWEQGSVNADKPLIYRSSQPAFYDKNLHALCDKSRTNNLLAHVRATGYSHGASVHDDNCHPFLYPGFKLALAHNGGLPGWRDMRSDILAASRPSMIAQLNGSTDTETLYCLLMSQYEDPAADMGADEIIDGLARFMKKIVDIKTRHGNQKTAKLKFFLADGNDLVVANMGLGFDGATEIDQDWNELRSAPAGSPERRLAGVIEPVWYLAGRDYAERDGEFNMGSHAEENMDSVIISSEHLTHSAEDWKPVNFQEVVFFQREGDRCSIRVQKLTF